MIHSKSRAEIVFQTAAFIMMSVFGCFTIYPFLNVLAKSLSTGTAMAGIKVGILPVKPTLQNYQILFQDRNLVNALLLSTARTVLGTMFQLTATALCAYALSKSLLRGRRFFIFFFLLPMYFSGGLLPSYILIRNLGLMNNLLVYILPGLFSTFNFLILLTNFKQIPPSYEESAKMDGASDFMVFFTIMIPLSGPIIATTALFCAVAHWNSWLDAMLYMTNTKLYTMQPVLQTIIKDQAATLLMDRARYGLRQESEVTFTLDSIKMATLFFTIVPMLFMYPFLQKYFVKGVMIGGIKG